VVGLRHPGRSRGVYRGRILLTENEWRGSLHAVGGQPGVRVVEVDTLLPIVEVEIESVAALRELRLLPQVSYVEPPLTLSDPSSYASGVSGCNMGGKWGETGTIPPRATSIQKST